MASYRRLLAKSVGRGRNPDAPRDEETLPGHLRIVGEVATEIVATRSDRMLRNMGLDPADWSDRLTAATVRAAVLHDIGKANEHFQAMVRGTRTLPQVLRHEVVGLWMLATMPAFDAWLFSGSDETTRRVTLRAIVGHHLQFDRSATRARERSGGYDVRVLAGHADVSRSLAEIGRVLQLPVAPRLSDVMLDLLDGCPPELGDLLDDSQIWWDRADDDTRRFASVVAALVIGADVCGSAIVRQRQDPAVWARQALETVCTGEDLRAASDRRLKTRPRRPFQEQVGASGARLTLAMAGCGSGKTVAAYDWAARHARRRKLFFCYPTTGTASEGFQDYAYPEFKDDADLIHSRADLDLERILDNGADDADTSTASANTPLAVSASVQAALKEQGLRLWQAPMIVCTADAVLGLVQHNRVGMFGSPAILGGAFVFDEVHLYDEWMFGVLLAFLDALREAPVLLMTATLQPARLEALRDLARCRDTTLIEVGGPEELETLERYTVSKATMETAFTRAIAEARRGKRVLWVANQVDRATDVGRRAEAAGVRVEPYHSRYRYEDRLERHETVISLFKPGPRESGALAVTTQVCEVSLDISADLLITDLAPPPSLIQRFGRLNRWATPDDTPGPLPVLIVEPDNGLPYGDEELALGRTWLSRLGDGPISQRKLADALDEVLAGQPVATRTPSPWLDAGWTFSRGQVRQGGVTISVVRKEDVDEVIARGELFAGAEVTRNTIPMLWTSVRREYQSWPRRGGALEVPSGRMIYSKRWGAAWL